VATSTPARRAWRVLTGLLVITAVLFGANALGVHVIKGGTWVPELALDLQGGTQIVLEAQTEEAEPSAEQLAQAVAIIRQRVDASGVGESEISTQGASNIVVQIPGNADEQTRERIQASAQLELRAVIYASGPTNTFVGEDGEETPYPTPDPSLNATPSAQPSNGSDPAWVSDLLWAQFQSYRCDQPSADLSSAPADQPLITCDTAGTAKYILGPVEMDGSSIADATNGMDPQNGQWSVNLQFDGEGAETFGQISQRLYGQQAPLNQFAFVLDGAIISAPSMNAVITDGRPSISGGGIDQDTSKVLADQLKFGALPLSFEVVSSDTISATLGSQQLQSGLIAGLIGLVLVGLFVVLVSYRALGFVIIASLIVMAVLTYILLCLLSWRLGYRLSLAGVAGLIVTIGFTADSFIVYFERIRDELRDGKAVTVAVEDGWARAKRTIYISKSINVLAAVVLYILADATVKGFAFTLGLTTVLDVLIFVMFTHPVMQLLVRTPFFGGGHPLSGLDPTALGAVYRGRAAFRAPVATGGRTQRSRGEAERRQTIAERKAAQLAAQAGPNKGAASAEEEGR
jgi:preprotein translocase subunit SecD